MITIFGTCRVAHVKGGNGLNGRITYCHNTREIIQFIEVLSGKKKIEMPMSKWCFRSSLVNRVEITVEHHHTQAFEKSSICIVEISSNKVLYHSKSNNVIHNLYATPGYSHLVDQIPKELNDEISKHELTADEIEHDMLQIVQMLGERKCVFVTHYDVDELPKRRALIDLVTRICEKHSLVVVNPRQELDKRGLYKSVVMDSDLYHYTPAGHDAVVSILEHVVKSFNTLS